MHAMLRAILCLVSLRVKKFASVHDKYVGGFTVMVYSLFFNRKVKKQTNYLKKQNTELTI